MLAFVYSVIPLSTLSYATTPEFYKSISFPSSLEPHVKPFLLPIET